MRKRNRRSKKVMGKYIHLPVLGRKIYYEGKVAKSAIAVGVGNTPLIR